MNSALRKISFFVGLGLLIISMYWSQDGFNFDLAGDAGYTTVAVLIAWFLALAVTVIEFVFSSNFKDLNSTLIMFGVAAYVYSIGTNHAGILHFQGTNPNGAGAWILAFIMDAVPEPLMAWALYESKTGDLIGNLIKAVMSAPSTIQNANQANYSQTKLKQSDSRPFSGKSTQKTPKFNLHGVNSYQIGRNLNKYPYSDDELQEKIRSLGYKSNDKSVRH